MSYSYGYCQGFDQSRTILAGVPRATLLIWQGQLLAAMISGASGTQPVSLEYYQGDGRKSVTHRMTSAAEVTGLLMLVNRCLGNPTARRPMRVFFG